MNFSLLIVNMSTRKTSASIPAEDKSKKRPVKGSASRHHKQCTNNVDDEDTQICYLCNVTFKNMDDKMVTCESCDQWVCLHCSDLSSKEYDLLCLTSNSIHWFCKNCNGKALTAVKADNLIEQRCKEYFESLKTAMNEIKEELATKIVSVENKVSVVDEKLSAEIGDVKKRIDMQASAIRSNSDKIRTCANSSTESTTSDSVKELADRNNRKESIIITNVGESDSDDVETRKKQDRDQVEGILRELKVEAEIVQVIRLGARGTRPRALKVKFASEIEQKSVLKNLET